MCKIEKDISEFYKNKSAKDGLQKRCIECHKYLYNRQGKDKIKEKNKNILKKLKENENDYINRLEYVRNYQITNKDKIRETKKEWSLNNKEKVKEIKSKWALQNRDKIKEKNIKYRKENRDKINDYNRKRKSLLRKNDLLFKLKEKYRTKLNRIFKYKKPKSTLDILGCSFEFYKSYLESKFQPWMNWENRGLYNGEYNYGWDIDHIIPLSSAKNEEDLIRLNHYSNLQPLCSKINRDIKRDRKRW
jgi:hypothetical protein